MKRKLNLVCVMLTAIITLLGISNIAWSAIKHNMTSDEDFIAMVEQGCKSQRATELRKGLVEEESGCELACTGNKVCIRSCHEAVNEAYNDLPKCNDDGKGFDITTVSHYKSLDKQKCNSSAAKTNKANCDRACIIGCGGSDECEKDCAKVVDKAYNDLPKCKVDIPTLAKEAMKSAKNLNELILDKDVARSACVNTYISEDDKDTCKHLVFELFGVLKKKLEVSKNSALIQELQRKCWEVPRGYSPDDLEFALQMAKEHRIRLGLLLKCSEFQAALQPSMEAAGRCWNPNCAELIDNDVRAQGNCPPLQEKGIDVTAGPDAWSIVKKLQRRGFVCFEEPALSRKYRCIKKAKIPDFPPSGSQL